MSDFYEGVCVGAVGMLALSFATMTALYVTALLADARPRRDRLKLRGSAGVAPSRWRNRLWSDVRKNLIDGGGGLGQEGT